MGVQSFNEEELVFMNRSHNALQSLQSMQLIANEFDNYSIDLIYGSHLNSNEVWHQNVQTALQFKPPHISCYALTVEEKTKLKAIIKKDKSFLPKPEIQAQQFEWLMNTLQKAGYHHYEVSNFALSNLESQHNSAYWQGKHYLGIGPGAHSFNSVSRSWNISNNNLYTKAVLNNVTSYTEIEWLTPKEQQNEYIMIAIRTAKGIDLEVYQSKYGVLEKEALLFKATSWIDKNLLQLKQNTLCVTPKGFLFADGIAADLFKA
jgi:oxygen-independent coproporphyrinogen-3 oxidase